MVSEFLAEDQFKALETAIQKARAKRGIHRVPTSNGEAFAYQFNAEIYWHVQGPDDSSIAKGAVPLERPAEMQTVVPLAPRVQAKTR